MRQLEGVVSLVDPAGVRAPEQPPRQLEYGLIQRLLRHAAGSADGQRRAGEAGVDVLYALAFDRELKRDAVYVDGPGRSRRHEVSVASRGRVPRDPVPEVLPHPNDWQRRPPLHVFRARVTPPRLSPLV